MARKKRTKVSKEETVITLSRLRDILNDFEKVTGDIDADTEIWLSSDEEGNRHSPLMIFKGNRINIGLESDKSRVTFYPSSSHTDWG